MLFCGLVVGGVLGGCHRDATPLTELVDRPRLADGVRMQDVRFYSAALKREMPYRVYLPATVAAGVKLPVVYLLHGGGGSYQNWSNYSDVAKYAGAGGGMILVMPEGESSYWVNAALKPEDRFGDYLTSDLIANVEGRFPAAKGQANRAIVGVSMGGYAAVELALTRPELFVFAGAISPAIDVPSRKFSWRRWGQWSRFQTIFGEWGSETRRAGDPFVLVQSADPSKTPYLYVTAGEQEALLEPNQRFVVRLKARGFAYEFHTKPGGHDWDEWDAQIPGCFGELIGRMKAAG